VALSVIFPKWINVLPTLAAVGGLLGATSVVGLLRPDATPKYFKVGYMPKQPGAGVQSPVARGAAGHGLSLLPHQGGAVGGGESIPNVATCYGCHADQRLAKLAVDGQHKVKTQFVRDAFAKNEPDRMAPACAQGSRAYVRNFPHNVHVNAGVSCYSCHGQITGMPVVYQVQPLSMSWCLDRHRDPTPHLVPKQIVTKAAVGGERVARAGPRRAIATSPARQAKRLLEKHPLDAARQLPRVPLLESSTVGSFPVPEVSRFALQDTRQAPTPGPPARAEGDITSGVFLHASRSSHVRSMPIDASR
jgi:hypothetical protein